jgi:hypothetical protein
MREVRGYLFELPPDQRTPEVTALIAKIIADANLDCEVAFDAGYEHGYLQGERK